MDEVAVNGLTALGIDPVAASGVRRLSGGSSGAGVFGLDLDGVPVVLKVSVSLSDQTGAGRELRFYRELADEVPVRTPPLLAGVTSGGHDVLLLGPAAPAPPAREWSDATWLEVARQLGRLHRTFHAAELEGLAWLGRDPGGGPTLQERREMWRSTPCAQVTEALLADLDLLVLAAAAPAPCLVHGDCHAQNLLLDADGELVWADWQAVRHGHGPEDLALLWQRAQFNGATPPRQATLTAYAEARGIRLDETFLSAVTAAELHLLLIGWPGFLLQEPGPGRDALFDHLHQLNAAWRR